MNGNFVINMLLQSNPALKQNPIVMNAIKMSQSGDVNGLKSLASNICKEQNMDVNDVLNSVSSQFGMK